MRHTAAHSNKNSNDIGPLLSVVYGLQVMAAEAKWLILSAIRSFEISRLKKRLQEEEALFGSLIAKSIENTASDPSSTGPDAGSCESAQSKVALKQIAFIKEEIAYLQRDRENIRQEFYERRKKKLGIA